MYKEIFHASSWKISKKRGGHKGLERTNIRPEDLFALSSPIIPTLKRGQTMEEKRCG